MRQNDKYPPHIVLMSPADNLVENNNLSIISGGGVEFFILATRWGTTKSQLQLNNINTKEIFEM